MKMMLVSTFVELQIKQAKNRKKFKLMVNEVFLRPNVYNCLQLPNLFSAYWACSRSLPESADIR